MIDQTISHYKILEKLGEGGMGVVYKAEDTKLDRMVALKFLPTHLAASEQDKARFIQEAKAAATLNHPNICTIHDIQEHDGQMFIVMEFVDGQTLRQKLAGITQGKAIDVGIQIAEGLSAAHDKGIVHRDIKSENIMIRKDGIVQIMDFGLAKLRASGSKITRLTKEGSTVGTAGYMSPEQVQGQDADHRSDIFSLGVMLHELLTGELPFKGVHETALMYEIVNVDAAPMSAIKPDIDPELDRIVLECLQKDPDERYNSVKDIAKDLKRFKRESSRQHLSRTMKSHPAMARTSTPSMPEHTEEISVRLSSKREIGAWVIAGILLSVLVFVMLRVQPVTESTHRMIRSSMVTPESLYIHSYGTVSGRPTLSSDGRSIAFKGILPDGSIKIFVRSLDEKEVHPVAGTDNGASPFWSHDGKMLGFFADGKMKKVDLSGGSPVTITVVLNERGATWNKNDIIVYCPDYQSGLFRISADGKGTPQQLTTLDSTRHEGSHRWPFFLPDGKHFLYLARTAVESGEAEGDAVFVGSIDGKESKMLVQSSFNAEYANGYLLFARNQALMAQHFDADNLSVTGDPVKLQDDVLNDPSYNIAVFSVSNNGILVYQQGETVAGARPILVSREGTILRTLGDNVLEQDQPRFSPDGKQIAMYMYDLRSRRSNIWVYDLQTNGRRRITTRPEGDFFPLWSPDGANIYFTTGSVFKRDIYRQSVSHNSREEVVYATPKNDLAYDISPDGSTLILDSREVKENNGDLFLLDLKTTDKKLVPFQSTRFNEQNARFSHDGKWVTFVSDESGEDEIYVKQSSQPDADPLKISSGGGNGPVWGIGLNELIYKNNQSQMVAVSLRFNQNAVTVENTKVLFRLPPFVSLYDMSPDGKSFVFSRFVEIQKRPFLSLIADWESGLENK